MKGYSLFGMNQRRKRLDSALRESLPDEAPATDFEPTPQVHECTIKILKKSY